MEYDIIDGWDEIIEGWEGHIDDRCFGDGGTLLIEGDKRL